jgi:hypothetical protein
VILDTHTLFAVFIIRMVDSTKETDLERSAQSTKEDSQDSAAENYGRSVATGQHSEVEASDCPDGGLRAWLVVLGVSAYSLHLMPCLHLHYMQAFLAQAST